MALLLSALIGLVIVAPQLWFINRLGNNYRGIILTGSDAELHYLARMQESVDGGSFGNPFIYEYKNSVPSTAYTISEAILAWPAKVFDISVPVLNILYKFLLPLVISLLVYGLTYRLIGDRLWAVVSMMLVVLGPTLVNFPDIVHLIHWDKVYTQFSLYARPINPEFSSILFFVYLHTLLTFLRKKTQIWFLLLGALLGLSFYVYLYSYTFFVALNLVVFLVYATKKEKEVSLGILKASVIGFVLGLFSIVNMVQLYRHPYFKNMAAVSDVVASHHPIISIVGIIMAIIFVIFALRRKDYPDLGFLGVLLTTSFVVVNQQIITGILIQEGHYHWYFNTPIFILILIVVGYNFVGPKHRLVGDTLAILTGLAAIASVALIQISSYQYWAPRTSVAQKYAPVLSWVKENTPKESVVFANQSLSELIPVYTSNNVVWEAHAAFYLLPIERRNFTPENIMAAPSLEKGLLPYRVDYLIWDTVENPDWKLDKYSFLSKLYDNGEFKIYGR